MPLSVLVDLCMVGVLESAAHWLVLVRSLAPFALRHPSGPRSLGQKGKAQTARRPSRGLSSASCLTPFRQGA